MGFLKELAEVRIPLISGSGERSGAAAEGRNAHRDVKLALIFCPVHSEGTFICEILL